MYILVSREKASLIYGVYCKYINQEKQYITELSGSKRELRELKKGDSNKDMYRTREGPEIYMEWNKLTSRPKLGYSLKNRVS